MCYNNGMKLIIFCDYGLDDAAATYDVLRLAKEYDGFDVVAIGGNVPSEISLRNAKKLLANVDYALPSGVRIVDTTGVPQPNEYLKEVHGDDGMGDMFDEKLLYGVPILCYEEWISSLSGECDVLSLGPMTLVENVLKRCKVRKFVLMGGNIAERPNFHGYEFNHALDRTAFTACSRYPHVAATMDTCRHPLLNVQKQELKGEGILCNIARRARQLACRLGQDGCCIWDDIAVKYLLHPDWFTTYTATDKDGNELTVAKYLLDKKYEEIMDI